MPSQTTPRTTTRTPSRTQEETSALYRAASAAWSDVRDALAEGQRSPSGRFGDAWTQTKLRAAMRGKPDFVELRAPQPGGAVALAPFDMSPEAVAGTYDAADQYGFELGNDPAAGSSEESILWARAATLLRQLNEITSRARTSARTGATEAARDIASFTEQGVSAIVRPLGAALGDATRPLAESAGSGFGFGLAMLVGLWAVSRAK